LLADTDQRQDIELAQARALAPSVDGFIVCTPIATTARWRDIAGSKPLVFVNRRAVGAAWVVVDQSAIVELAVQHLRDNGHEAIAVVRGPAAYWSARQRDRVIRSLQGVVAIGPVRPDYNAGFALANELLTAGVTGVAAFNDQQALGIIAGARAAGRFVPDDLSVIGSDDIDVAAMSSPALTSVAAPMKQLGEVAFGAIDHMLTGGGEQVSTTLSVELSIRESTAPPIRSRATKGTST